MIVAVSVIVEEVAVSSLGGSGGRAAGDGDLANSLLCKAKAWCSESDFLDGVTVGSWLDILAREAETTRVSEQCFVPTTNYGSKSEGGCQFRSDRASTVSASIPLATCLVLSK